MHRLDLVIVLSLLLVGGELCARESLAMHVTTSLQDPSQTTDSTAGPAAKASAEEAAAEESIAQWQFRQAVQLVPAESATYYEVIVTPEVFDQARPDLSDLRLYDARGREIPYDLQIRLPQQDRQLLSVKEFNRATGPGDSQELSLDLGEDPVEHNGVEVTTKGTEYRRRAVVEGSNDAQDWKILKDDVILQMVVDGKDIKLVRIEYPSSRYRYLRVRVYPDPLQEGDSPEIILATPVRHVEVPGEYVWRPAKVGERLPVRAEGDPGSSWMIELGGNNTPCDQLEVQFASIEFHRSYYLEIADVGGGLMAGMYSFHQGTFERKLGDQKPLVAEFREDPTSRIRLVIVDHRNPPLKLQAVRYRGAVRAVVFAVNPNIETPLYLYYGNATAGTPGYDFARSLPAKLPSTPLRLELLPRESNPAYVPPPKPLTERWPWLVYAVLSIAIAGLAGLILSVSRTAIASADAQPENAEMSV